MTRWASSAPRSVWMLTGALACLGLAGSVFVTTLEPIHAPFGIPWWGIGLLYYLAERPGVHIEFRNGAHTFTVGEICLVVGLFFCLPVGLVAGMTSGFIVLFVEKRPTPVKLVFNLFNRLTSLSIALITFHALAGPIGQPAARAWAAALAAALAAGMFEIASIGIVLALTSSITTARWIRMATIGVASTVGNACLGLGMATVMWLDAAAVLLLVAPIGGLWLACRAYASQLDKAETLRYLYESSGMNPSSLETAGVFETILETASDMFKAERVALVLFPDAEDEPFREALLGPDGFEASSHASPSEARFGYLTKVAEPALATASSHGHLADGFSETGIEDAIVAPLVTDDRLVGAMIVGNRLGNIRKFDDHDLRVLVTMANQVAATLQGARLMDRVRHEVELREHRAMHDQLTGLPNRMYLRELGAAVIQSGNSGVCLLVIDIDRFGEVNDTLGHQSGDLLLQQSAARLSAALPPNAVLARLGGDEFAVVISGASDDAAFEAGLGAIAALRAPLPLGEVSVAMEASCGVARWPKDGGDIDTLLQKADVAMHLAKVQGGTCELYDPARDGNSLERLTLAGELRAAVEGSLLTIVHQPQANLSQGRVVATEALCRWEHPRRGNIPPDEFIPLAEKTGLIGPLTMSVLRRALEDRAAFAVAGFDIGVAVNVSARSLIDVSFVTEIERNLKETGTPPGRLTLEITESTIMIEPDRAAKVLHRLNDLGVHLSIDDFGTGFSALAYLKRLPVREVKIDRSFVFSMIEDPDDAAIVRSTIELGHNLGLSVVAEGVETDEMWRALGDNDCDVAQGYLLSRPVPALDLLAWMQRWSSDRQPARLRVIGG